MKRRTLLKRSTVLTGVTLSLAGCSGDGGDGDSSDGGSDGSGGGSDSPSNTGESGMNRKIEVFPEGVRENVTVVSVEEVEATDQRVEVDITLRNDSDEEVRMDHYSIALTAFTSETITEEQGDRAQDRIQAATSPEYDTAAQEPTASGETVTLGFSIEVPSDSDATIQSYLVTVGCGGAYDPPGCG